MGGGGINVYFGGDCQKVIERMEKGVLSKICQKAVREWDISSDDVLVLEKQEAELEEEKRKIDAKINAIDKKLDAISVIRDREARQSIAESERRKKDLEFKKEAIEKHFVNTAKKYGKRKEWAEKLFIKYWDVRLEGEEPDIGRFIGKVAHKEQQEETPGV